MATLHWAQLRVTNANGTDIGTLGDVVREGQATGMTLRPDGSLDTWPDHFVSAPDEEPEWDTPHGPVDWTGLAEATGTDRTH
jgi:hypothetical protein